MTLCWLSPVIDGSSFIDAWLFVGCRLLPMVCRSSTRGSLLAVAVACYRWLFVHRRVAPCWLSPVIDGSSFIDAWLFAGCRLVSMVFRSAWLFAGCRLSSMALRSSTRGSLLTVACCRWLFVHRRVAFCWLSPVVDGFLSVDAWLFAGCRLLSMAFGFLLAVSCCRLLFVHRRVASCSLLSMAFHSSTRGCRLLSMALRSSTCAFLLRVAFCRWLFVDRHAAFLAGNRLLSMAFCSSPRGSLLAIAC